MTVWRMNTVWVRHTTTHATRTSWIYLHHKLSVTFHCLICTNLTNKLPGVLMFPVWAGTNTSPILYSESSRPDIMDCNMAGTLSATHSTQETSRQPRMDSGYGRLHWNLNKLRDYTIKHSDSVLVSYKLLLYNIIIIISIKYISINVTTQIISITYSTHAWKFQYHKYTSVNVLGAKKNSIQQLRNWLCRIVAYCWDNVIQTDNTTLLPSVSLQVLSRSSCAFVHNVHNLH